MTVDLGPRPVDSPAAGRRRMTVAEIVARSSDRPLPVRITAYDGSARRRPPTRGSRLHAASQRGLSYLLTAPGDLGMARAYVQPATWRSTASTPATRTRCSGARGRLQLRLPVAGATRSRLAARARLGRSRRRRPRRRRRRPAGGGSLKGLRHSRDPGRRGDPPPLRRLQRVLRDGPRPVDDLHLRVLPDRRRTLEQAQDDKYDLVAGKLGLKPGHAAARRRLRLGRHGPARGPRVRRDGARA